MAGTEPKRIIDFEATKNLELDDAFLIDGPSGTKHILVEDLYQNVATNAVGNVGHVVNEIVDVRTQLLSADLQDTKTDVSLLSADLQDTKTDVSLLSADLQDTKTDVSLLSADLQDTKTGMNTRIEELENSKTTTNLQLVALNSSLGGCQFEQEGSDFYIIGENPEANENPEAPPLKQKIGSGDGSGNGGTTDYDDLENKPSINEITLEGSMSSSDILKPIKFGGLFPAKTYDGTEEIIITFPDTEVLNQTAGTPVGEIISFMGTVAPANYLICDGSEYNITDYPYLAQHFIDNFESVNYFGGDGETTFAVPDLRGEFLRGSGTNEHESSGNGANVGEHQYPTKLPAMGSQGSANDGWVGAMGGAESVYPPDYTSYYNADSKGGSSIGIFLGTSSNRTGSFQNKATWITSRPTNTSVLYCIKYQPTHFMTTKHMYSYQEQRVGTWIDGKPLYEKAFNVNSLPNNTYKEIPHGIENVDKIWIHDGFVHYGNGGYFSTSAPNPTEPSAGWYSSVDRGIVAFRTAQDHSTSTAVLILRYTKTTD